MSTTVTKNKDYNLKSAFSVGDEVLISPQVTHEKEWVKGIVIEVENNPFVGIVITAKTKELGGVFEKEYLFKKIN
ncbi:MAG: transcriptional regulator [Capnocytophaga sp.]|nr:transcriptional regulator [Capnocytophaga sp.]